MATNHTTNYNLNLWEANDKFVREEFNENTTKIDAAIKAEADARAAAVTAETNARTSALTALTQTVNTKARVAAGSYEGDGAATRVISVGFTPKAVLVMTVRGIMYISGNGSTYIHGGLAVEGSPMNAPNIVSPLQIVPGGFQVACQLKDSYWAATNYSSTTFNYIALG